MTQQNNFEKAIAFNNIEKTLFLLKDKSVNPADDYNWAICYASEKGYFDLVTLLIKDKRVNPADKINCSIGLASKNGHINIVKLLLNDERVDPSDGNNWAIRDAFYFHQTEILKLLWNDKRVKISLHNHDEDLYNKLTTEEIKNKIESFEI
jgi:hypothetical protein